MFHNAGLRFAVSAIALAVAVTAGCTGGDDGAFEPVPTLTPPAVAGSASPTPTVSPCLVDAAYQEAFVNTRDRLADLVITLEALIAEPQPDSESWEESLATTADEVVRLSLHGQQLTAPPRFEGTHAFFQAGLGEYIEAGILLQTETEDLSAVLGQASEMLTVGKRLVEQATASLPTEPCQ